MSLKTYMVLLADRKNARMFTLTGGAVGQVKECKEGYVPQKVKHGDDTWDAPDKIFRHIEDHLHRHLSHVAQTADTFAKENQISSLIIGSHKPLFPKIEKHLSAPLRKKIKGTFVTELKAPFNTILARAIHCRDQIEN